MENEHRKPSNKTQTDTKHTWRFSWYLKIWTKEKDRQGEGLQSYNNLAEQANTQPEQDPLSRVSVIWSRDRHVTRDPRHAAPISRDEKCAAQFAPRHCFVLAPGKVVSLTSVVGCKPRLDLQTSSGFIGTLFLSVWCPQTLTLFVVLFRNFDISNQDMSRQELIHCI